MASGDLTASTPTFATTQTEVATQINTLQLALATDMLFIVPRNNGYIIFKVEREA